MPAAPAPHSTAAIVSKASRRQGDADLYLRLTSKGVPDWVDQPCAATVFASMREATRASLRLPSALRAFALPRDIECSTHAGWEASEAHVRLN